MSKKIHVRCSDEMHAEASLAAREEGMSLNDWMINAVRDSLKWLDEKEEL